MLSRLSYMFREMWASLRRNLTLTAAAIITASVSLLLFGLTLLIQRGFDNQLSQWSGGVKMIVYVENDASPEQLAVIREALESTPDIVDVPNLQYLDVQQSLVEAQRLFAADPETLQLLNDQNIPSQFKVVPTDAANAALLQQLSTGFKKLPKVQAVSIPSEFIAVLESLKGFIGIRLYLITGFLLLSAVLLIWNTIRTAIFARRREIEVMKLVGATNWFIRIPFMLEGLLQGLIGGVVSCAGVWALNSAWSGGVAAFKPGTGISSLVVPAGYLSGVMVVLLLLGAAIGAIGSAIAASRFLDV